MNQASPLQRALERHAAQERRRKAQAHERRAEQRQQRKERNK